MVEECSQKMSSKFSIFLRSVFSVILVAVWNQTNCLMWTISSWKWFNETDSFSLDFGYTKGIVKKVLRGKNLCGIVLIKKELKFGVKAKWTKSKKKN